MGSFNKIGFQSGIPIMEDGSNIVFFICSHKDRIMDDSPILIGESSLCPICLPLYGTYNGYGSIDVTQRDSNIILIEEKFGDTIENFLGAIQDIIGIPLNELLKKTSKLSNQPIIIKLIDFLLKINFDENSCIYTTMEHLDVYHNIINSFNKPFINNDKWDKGANIGDFWLSALGFVKNDNNEHVHTYNLPNCPYYITSRGYTPPKIMLGEKEMWSSYGGICEFIENFNRIAHTTIKLNNKFISYSSVDVSFYILMDAMEKKQLDKLKTVDKIEIDRLLDKFKDNDEMIDYIKNRLGHFNIFNDDLYVAYNDIIPLCKYNDMIDKNHMCLYDGINILSNDYKDIVCLYVKFNNSLRMMCSSYKLSAYAFQSINQYKSQFTEIYEYYLKKIKELTPIND